MARKFVSIRNLKFLLHEVFDTAALSRFDYFKDHNEKMANMILNEALKLAKDLYFPTFREMDQMPPELEDGQVRVHPAVKDIIKQTAEGGWMTAPLPYDMGGDQLPFTVVQACRYIFASANYSAAAFTGLTSGAAHLITSFGNRDLNETYVPHMHSGRWQGTMALTEPEAGSSLSDLTTTAVPTDEEYYLIRGQKIFISAGDHDAVENAVHLMLARIEGAPAGVKGISLFVVPKLRPDGNGGLTPNDLATSGVYHKMGYKGCPIVQLSMGDKNDCRGWLVGEAHKGLSYMFQMMNEARIGVGMGAAAMATGAYYAALDYAKTRMQGRKIGQKDLTQPPVPIIEHADVKRMLLFQRAVIDGSVSVLVQCAKYVDMLTVLPDGDEKEKCHLLIELLTPVAKTYPSEMGIAAISQGLQCLGGSGYCDDYPLEQYYRDARIHPIHEGTTGIQGMDLLGRKIFMKKGRAIELFAEEIQAAAETAGQDEELAPYAEKLLSALALLQKTTLSLIEVSKTEGPEPFLADAVLYLELFGTVTIAWQWLLQGIAARLAMKGKTSASDRNFYMGKVYALRYFFHYELPKTEGLAARLTDGDSLTVEMQTEFFND